MTFEEYKKKFEVFSRIDSPEKLAICESQYRMHLLHVEAQHHFEPFEFYSGKDRQFLKYENELQALLPFYDITENQLSLLIRPSFESESLLIIEKLPDKYRLTYTALNKNYWGHLYKGGTVTGVGNTTLTGDFAKHTGDNLFSLLDSVIAKAKKPDRGGFVLDGVVFILCRILEGKKNTVFKHSPLEGSKTAQILDMLHYLINNITGLNDTVIAELDRQINEYMKVS